MGVGILYGLSIVCVALAVLGPWLTGPTLTRRANAGTSARQATLFLLAIAVALAAFLGYRVGWFYTEHWSGFRPGSIRHSAVDELAQYHSILLIACIVAGIGIIRHHWHAAGRGRLLAGSAGVVAAVLAAAAMVLTLPRSGEEGLMLWIVLAPGTGLSMLVLLIVSVSLATRRSSRSNEPERMALNVPLCPRCSYQLTGNVSGMCPECGSSVPESVRRILEASVSAANDIDIVPPPDRAVFLAFTAGSACILLSIFSNLLPMIRLLHLPGVSTFLIWRVEPWWLGLAMGSAIIAAAKALPERKKWSLAICFAWAFGNMSLGVINVVHAMPLWQQVPPFMFTARRFVPWLALHLAWSFALPIYLLFSLRDPSEKENS